MAQPKEVVIAVANVTSLQGAWALVKDLRWDILLVQETRTRPGCYPEAEIRRAGWKWLPGPPETPRRGTSTGPPPPPRVPHQREA